MGGERLNEKYSYKAPHGRTSCTPHEVSAFIYILIDVEKKKKKGKEELGVEIEIR